RILHRARAQQIRSNTEISNAQRVAVFFQRRHQISKYAQMSQEVPRELRETAAKSFHQPVELSHIFRHKPAVADQNKIVRCAMRIAVDELFARHANELNRNAAN